VLADSSAWILALRGKIDLLELAGENQIMTCLPVIQEILQGAESPKDYAALRAMFDEVVILDAPMPLVRFEQAAQLYLRCRDDAFTIRKGPDCLIAACAIAHRVPVMHRDRDFDHIALVTGLTVVRV
jgi:predicted nucleic acid-binding protein